MVDGVIEVAVIGSGFGGSVMAGRLAESGVKVTVLERGPWRDTVPTRSMGIEHRAKFPRGVGMLTGMLRDVGGSRPFSWQMRFSKTGLFEIFFGNGVNVVSSSNVGGGSHVYSAVHCKPAMDDFWDGHADGVSASQMEPHYQAVLARMESVAPTPEHRLPNTTYRRYSGDNILEPAQPYAQARIGYLLPADPDHPKTVVDKAGVERAEVDYASNDDGFLGSPGGGKTTLDVTYLWPGMKSGNLDVRDMSQVLEIRRLDGRSGARYQITFADLRRGRRDTVLAKNVVVAAGGLNTLRLLLASRNAGALTGMPRLGHKFGTNGDVLAFWDYQSEMDLSAGLPTRGGFKLRGVEDTAILGGGAFPSIDHYPLPAGLKRRFKRSLMIAGLGEDAMDGQASFDAGSFRLAFDAGHSPVFEKIWSTLDQIAAQTGKPIYFRRSATTVHPMGGAGLGRDETTGVVGADGEVFGHPGLFVSDAAAFPISPGAPPTLSIAAWADHMASRFLARAGASAGSAFHQS